LEKLKFSVEDISLKEEIENSQFVRARIKAFASGQNSHGIPVLESALTNAESTIFEKPLVWMYSQKEDDALGHETDEVPCGFVPRQGANISYERADDGRLFFCVDVLIWRYYSGKILEIFKQTDGKKAVSVEIQILEMANNEDNVQCIADFCYLAITILGEKFVPAIKGAEVQIIEFSNDKVKVEEILQKTFSDIKIKEKEDDMMGFNKEEFAKTFSLTANELWEVLSNACNDKKFMDGDYECSKFWMRDFDGEYIYAFDYEENRLCAIPYTISDGKPTLDFDNVKKARLAYIVSDDDTSDDLVEFAEKILSKKMSCKEKEFATEKEELTNQINIYTAKITELETANSEFNTKFTALETEKNDLSTKFSTLENENTELKIYRDNKETQEKKDKIEFAINSVSEDLTAEQIDEWRNKSNEFENIDSFTNAIQSFAYSVSKGKNKNGEGFTRMSIPHENDNGEKSSNSVWERI
jgi:hypothetical protein